MIPELIEKIVSEDNQVSLSIYQLQNKKTYWLQVSAAILELTEDNYSQVIDILIYGKEKSGL